MSILSYGMKTNRILLSDKHFHTVQISEQALGIIQHALHTLGHAFEAEHEYKKLINNTHAWIDGILHEPVDEEPTRR